MLSPNPSLAKAGWDPLGRLFLLLLRFVQLARATPVLLEFSFKHYKGALIPHKMQAMEV